MATYKEILITPELAKLMLGSNQENRDIATSTVESYAEAMENGLWQLNGDAIRFSKSGRLIDGQHRLLAIIKSNTPVTILVIRDLDEKAQETIDRQKKRSLKDILKFRHEKNYTTLSGVIRAVYLWEYNSKKKIGSQGNKSAITDVILLRYFEENAQLLRDITPRVDNIRRSFPVSSTIIAPLILETDLIDYEDSIAFWQHLLVGTNPFPEMGSDDPILKLRQMVQKIKNDAKGGSYDSLEMGALIIKAWNAYRKGDPIKALRWRKGGANPEAFPEMV